MSTANVIWLDSWVEIMTLKWSSSGPFCEAKRIPDWFELWFFVALTVCVLASTPGSDLWASWCWRVSHAKLLGPLFCSQMRCAKINCEPWAAEAKWKGELLQTCATVSAPETPNLMVLKIINHSTLQMMTKGEENQRAEQLKVWPSSDR